MSKPVDTSTMEPFLEEAFAGGHDGDQLHINNKFFGDKGCQRLRTFLLDCGSIKSLELQANNITSEGLGILSDAIGSCSTLKSINLEWNPLRDDAGFHTFCKVISSHSCLEAANFRECQIGQLGAKHLAAAIQVNRSIKILDLSHNLIGVEGAISLLQALQDNPVITALDLTGNGVGYETIVAIERLLKRNQSQYKSPESQRLEDLQKTLQVKELESTQKEGLLKSSVEILQQQLETAEKALSQTENMYDVEKQRSKEIPDLRANIHSLQESVDIKDKTLAELRQRIAEQQAQHGTLLVTQQDQEREIAETKEKLMQKQREYESLANRFRDKQTAHDELRAKYEDIHKERLDIEEQGQQMQRELATQVSRLTESRNQLELRVTEQQRKVRILQQEATSQRESMNAMKEEHHKEIETITLRCSTAEARCHDFEQQTDSLKSELLSSQLSVKNLENYLSMKDEQITRTQERHEQQLRECTAQQAEVRDRLEKRENYVSELRQQFVAVEQQASVANTIAQQKDANSSALRQQLEKLNKELTDTQREKVEIADKLYEKTAALAELISLTDQREEQRKRKLHSTCSQIKHAIESISSL
eukprot:GHVQ01026143.1.p1 GENE.GHVQ01026143.1~~GHVQ01026143.1.p1  ORF type:complete len:593 (+),score=90.61 GHVQ01026143.1:478-2256(+)